jgi:hypothetical protein
MSRPSASSRREESFVRRRITCSWWRSKRRLSTFQVMLSMLRFVLAPSCVIVAPSQLSYINIYYRPWVVAGVFCTPVLWVGSWSVAGLMWHGVETNTRRKAHRGIVCRCNKKNKRNSRTTFSRPPVKNKQHHQKYACVPHGANCFQQIPENTVSLSLSLSSRRVRFS